MLSQAVAARDHINDIRNAIIWETLEYGLDQISAYVLNHEAHPSSWIRSRMLP